MVVLGYAGDLELWDGNLIEDVELIGVSEGKLILQKQNNVRLVDITQIKSFSTFSTQIKIRYCGTYTLQKKEGFLCSVTLNGKDPQIPLPLVRIFLYQKLPTGKNVSTLYVNQRYTDPTAGWDIPMVDFDAVKELNFFIEPGIGLILAAYVEVWQRGILRQKKEFRFSEKDIEADWYRVVKPSATRTINPLMEKLQEQVSQEVEKITMVPAKATIKSAVIKSGEGEGGTYFRMTVTLFSHLPKVPLPQTTLSYVLEDKQGNISVRREKVDPKAGRDATLINKTYEHTVEKKLDSNIVLSLLEMDRGKIQNPQRLVHWRVDVHYNQEVVASYEPESAYRKKLPDRWWE